jgi:hypothetical protein
MPNFVWMILTKFPTLNRKSEEQKIPRKKIGKNEVLHLQKQKQTSELFDKRGSTSQCKKKMKKSECGEKFYLDTNDFENFFEMCHTNINTQHNTH